METSYVISDDDDSIGGASDGVVEIDHNITADSSEVTGNHDAISISSDEDSGRRSSIENDMQGLPEVVVGQKNAAISNLFRSKNNEIKPNSARMESNKFSTKKVLFPQNNKTNVKTEEPKRLGEIKTEVLQRAVHKSMPIQGVEVSLPVKPYGCQIILMARIIQGIKTSKNCILESPTGSGKTLALLCGVLAWQQAEEKRVCQEEAKSNAQAYFSLYPELQKQEVMDFIATPTKKPTDVTPEKLFAKNNFGETSIYQKSDETPGQSPSTSGKRMGPYRDDSDDDCTEEGLVTIHKKPRLGSINDEDLKPKEPPVTPQKDQPNGDKETPEKVRKLYDLVNNLRLATSCFVDCRVPVIYYGARTHMQLQQVIKEFRRTSYCGQVKMSLLSSRDKSCIRPFNRDQWASKNDMCRACIKSVAKPDGTKNPDDTNCKYYDNRRELNHGSMPPAFDLEELVAAGEDKQACPYYGAREMAKTADIIFCPYNYLIDPSIRSNLKIDLEGSIIVIDEAHNIESNCRDAASMTVTQAQVRDALKEIEKVGESRFANQEVLGFIDELVLSLKGWDDWFQHQLPLLESKRIEDSKAIHAWTESQTFVETLNNHNIGYKQFPKFKSNCEVFCRRLRDDPRTLLGVTQTTGTLLEALTTVFGYLYREDCAHLDDYKMVLEKFISGRTGSFSAHDSWRKSHFNKGISTQTITLRLICLNAGIVMSALTCARSIILASGTLTPVGNIHAELAAHFPLVASPPHIISMDRVWVGIVSGDNQGSQEYTSRGNKEPSAAERLGRLVTRVCRLTPHGVLCFITSYTVLDAFIDTWRESGLWSELQQLKHVFCEKRNSSEHEEMMQEFYQCVGTTKGALLFAVYRGKVSEGMDFKDHQARAVICVGIPYPNMFDKAVEAKMEYNNKYHHSRGLLAKQEWLRVQAYRALNQAVGRCVRHRLDWGAVLLVDARYCLPYNVEHLSKWVRKFLGNNLHTYESIESSPSGLAEFMKRMQITEEEEATCE